MVTYGHRSRATHGCGAEHSQFTADAGTPTKVKGKQVSPKIKDGYGPQSLVQNWAAGDQSPVGFDWIASVLGEDVDQYDIDHLLLRCAYTHTGASGLAALGIDAARMIERVQLWDVQGLVLDVKGTSLRAINMEELGDRFADPSDGSVDSANSDTLLLKIPFGLDNEIGVDDDRDTRMPARCLLGGRMVIKWSGATLSTTVTINSGAAYVEAFVTKRRGRRKEAPGRLVWEEATFTLADHIVPVIGSMRKALMFADKGAGNATGYEAFTHANYDEVDSKTFDLSDTKRVVLRNAHRHATARSSLDLFVNNNGIAFFSPNKASRFTHLPKVRNVHAKLAAAPPTNTIMLMNYYSDRSDAWISAATGVPSSQVESFLASANIATRDGRVAKARSRAGEKGSRRVPIKRG